MKTLLDILTGYISDTDQWGIYAELIDGQFQPNSAADFVSVNRKAVSSPLSYFMSNRAAIQELNSRIKSDTYTDLLESPRLMNAAEAIIDHINKAHQRIKREPN